MEERHQDPVVVGMGLVQEQDPVGGAADGFGGMAGEGFQAAPDEPGRPQLGGGQLALQPVQRGQRRRVVGRQRGRDEGVHFGQAGVLKAARAGQVIGAVNAQARVGKPDLVHRRIQRNVPPRLAGAEPDQGGVAQPQPGLAGEKAQVDDRTGHGVFKIADDPAARPFAADDGQHELAVGIEEKIPDEEDLVLEHAQVPEEPERDPDTDVAAVELDVVPFVEVFDQAGEMGLDGLAVVGALGRQLAERGVEIAVQDGEIDGPLIGGQVEVGGPDDAPIVGPPAVRGQGGPQDLVAGIGHDEQDVGGAAVADEEGPLDAGHAGHLVLDLERGDRLPARVLVDVLDPVDDLVVAVGQDFEHVAGRQPVIRGRVDGIWDEGPRAGVLEIAGDIIPADLQLPLRAEAGLDAGQGPPVGVVDVFAGLGHGDPARPLGHPESAAKGHAVLLEEPEDLGIQISGGRQPPAQIGPQDAGQDRGRIGPRPRRAEGILRRCSPEAE